MSRDILHQKNDLTNAFDHHCSISCMRLITKSQGLDLSHKEMSILLLANIFILIFKVASQLFSCLGDLRKVDRIGNQNKNNLYMIK